jgi:hypothetical protein
VQGTLPSPLGYLLNFSVVLAIVIVLETYAMSVILGSRRFDVAERVGAGALFLATIVLLVFAMIRASSAERPRREQRITRIRRSE